MEVHYDLDQVILRMNVVSDTRPITGADAQPAADTAIRNHPAFCQLALPVRSSKGVWRRDVEAASVTIESGASLESSGEHREGGLPIPTGKYARLLLMHICDSAIRADSAVVELGASAREFAETVEPDIKGPKLRELTDQLDRVLAARFTVSLDGGLALAMFDARGRARGGIPVWRPSIRLNSKFFAGLTANSVALDRRIVGLLADAPMALDAYTWLTFLLPQIAAGAASFTNWEDLLARFAPASQQVDEFREAFEQSLRQVSELCPLLSLVIREQGVECRVSTRRMPAPAVITATIPSPAAVAKAEPARSAEDLEPAMQAVPAAIAVPAPAIEAVREFTAAPAYLPIEADDEMAREIAAEIASSLVAPVLERRIEREIPPHSAPVPVARPMNRPMTQDVNREANRQTMSLKSHLTGLSQVIWLQRANGRDNLVIEVTPGGRYDPENVTVLALEPMILQIAGGLNARDFERVAAWANANRDLIDEFWEGCQDPYEEMTGRVKKVPPPGWR